MPQSERQVNYCKYIRYSIYRSTIFSYTYVTFIFSLNSHIVTLNKKQKTITNGSKTELINQITECTCHIAVLNKLTSTLVHSHTEIIGLKN